IVLRQKWSRGQVEARLANNAAVTDRCGGFCHLWDCRVYQRDVLALELAVDLSPIGLDAAAMTLLGADRSEQCRLQSGVGHLSRQWPAEKVFLCHRKSV